MPAALSFLSRVLSVLPFPLLRFPWRRSVVELIWYGCRDRHEQVKQGERDVFLVTGKRGTVGGRGGGGAYFPYVSVRTVSNSVQEAWITVVDSTHVNFVPSSFVNRYVAQTLFASVYIADRDNPIVIAFSFAAAAREEKYRYNKKGCWTVPDDMLNSNRQFCGGLAL